jgi:uncharacterized protein YkwD
MSDPDRLRVTAEDIAALGERVAAPPVLTIGLDDVTAHESVAGGTPAIQATRRGPIQITAEDVAAFEPAGEALIGPLEQQVLALINEARETQLPRWLGRGPLRWHPALAQTARRHSADMLQRRYVAHVTPEGVQVAGRLERAGISYLACGENIGVVYGPASHGERGVQAIHAAFMDQPRRLANHRGNILNPVWTHVGVGVAYAPEGQLIVTQNFIATLTKPV